MFKNQPIMGILNVTPDSFSDGGMFFDLSAAVAHAKSLIEQGANILDIGGQSTRPGYVAVSEDEELARVLPVIKEIRCFSSIPLSIDTFYPKVASAALEVGASIINDIKGMDTPGMDEVIGHYQAPIILMHSRKRRQELTAVEDIQQFYQEKIAVCKQLGLTEDKICLDPGIGFAKSAEENLDILKNPQKYLLPEFASLVGVSRKRTIGYLTSEENPLERDFGSVAASLCLLNKGVDIVRVHQVKGMKDALTVMNACK